MTAEPTNMTIALTGAKVVWGNVDVDARILAPKSVRGKITDGTKAIVVVHYAGMICDRDSFNAISKSITFLLLKMRLIVSAVNIKGR